VDRSEFPQRGGGAIRTTVQGQVIFDEPGDGEMPSDGGLSRRRAKTDRRGFERIRQTDHFEETKTECLTGIGRGISRRFIGCSDPKRRIS
jgi:hypothetical protein